MAEFAAETVAGDLPVVAITMGDPAGVGPEVAVKALRHDVVWEACRPLLVGDPAVLEAAARICGSPGAVVPVVAAPGAEVAAAWDRERINVVASGSLDPAGLRRGEASAAAGDAGYRAIANAVRLAQRGAAAATVTGPIHKEALNRAGHHFAGQTEVYAHLTGTRDYAMLLMAGTLRVVHVSTHVSLREACARVTRERVDDRDSAGPRCRADARPAPAAHRGGGTQPPRRRRRPVRQRGGGRDRIPAIGAAQAEGIAAEGPLPVDTLFPKANGGFYDLVVAMYHDQGHIPTKVVGFTWDNGAGEWSAVDGVNVTLGIPVIRVSVDHGTAFDVAGTGRASEASMVQAILCAAQMATHRGGPEANGT